MSTVAATRAEPWLRSPLRTEVGDLQLAGLLHNVEGLNPAAMRVLGSYALILLVSGNGYYCDGRGARLNLAPGDAVLVFPELAHAYGPRGGGAWSQVYYVFAGPQFDLWREGGILRPEQPVLRLGNPEYWQQRLAAVVQLESREPALDGVAVRALGRFLEVLAEMLATDAAATRAPEADAWLEKSLRLLGHRTARGWTRPQDVAREVGLSYETFRKRFAQRTGESPGQHQKRRRLEWACAAMYHGDHTIKQIAHELGFCDVFHFSKAFKQVVGTTPSEYRKKMGG